MDIKALFKNRFFMTGVSLFYILIGTCTYYGWQHMRYILVIEDKFIDLCLDNPEQTPLYEEYACDAQGKAISTAYTIASSCEYAGAIVAGIMYDHMGPRYTALIGIVMHCVSWIFLLGSDGAGLLYTGFAMQGLAVNISAFPAFILADFFPGHEFLMEAVNLAAQCTAPLINPIVYTVMTEGNLSWFASMIGLLILVVIFGVLYVLVMPKNNEALFDNLRSKDLPVPKHEESKLSDLFVYMAKPEYIAFSVWYVLMVMQYTMFSSSIDVLASPSVAKYIGWIFWLQGPIGVAWGVLNDKVLNLPIIISLSGCQLVSFVLALINASMAASGHTNEILFYISASIYVISNAYVFTSKYTFVTEFFPRNHFGKLAGAIGLYAGVLQNFNILVINADLTPVTTLWIYLSFCIPEALLLAYLGYRKYVSKTNYIGDTGDASANSLKSGLEEGVEYSSDSDSESSTSSGDVSSAKPEIAA